ncbi:hypothetical protein C922_05524 [Plasmodium inui San Antonio 1]|uniref:Uncharacterized protein n=1 Tax=Plasmodium inui San Antonio 1 TaxID=1237626 RepID=W6ZT62_9APIC|nr:hypothetical protein C922_05524 [Plasmodium inui San Antonio 1]EUD64097.1 hypothetical protein C922_05524 [Plasmodium inui San Antonio 1]
MKGSPRGPTRRSLKCGTENNRTGSKESGAREENRPPIPQPRPPEEWRVLTPRTHLTHRNSRNSR